MWPADGGEPDPIEHPGDTIAPTRDPDGIAPAGSRPPRREPPITRDGPLPRVHTVMRHMRPAPATVRWHGARGKTPECRCWRPQPGSSARWLWRGRARPITIPTALNNSRCRTRAKAAGQLTSDARPNPREAASR